jgi:hypothetical protein
LRLPDRAFHEHSLGDVIREARAIDEIGAEILDTHHSGEGSDLEILGVDLRLAHVTANDLRFDHLLRARRLGRLRARRLLVPEPEKTSGRRATRHAEEQRQH